MTTIREEAGKVEAIARQAFHSVCNDYLRGEIQQIADILHEIAIAGVESAEHMRLYADSFDLCTQGTTHRLADRVAKADILDGMRRIEKIAYGN